MAKSKTGISNTEVKRQEASSETAMGKKKADSLEADKQEATSSEPISTNQDVDDTPNYNFVFQNLPIELQEKFTIEEEKLRKEIKDYEPNDLSKIKDIFQEAEKTADEAENYNIKMSYLNDALYRISIIINNSKLAFGILEKKGYLILNQKEDFKAELVKANKYKKDLETKIQYLWPMDVKEPDNLPEVIKQDEDNVKTSIPEPKPDEEPKLDEQEYMTVNEVVTYLKRKGLRKKGKSTIDHKRDEIGIPYHTDDSGIYFRIAEIDKWLEDGMPKTPITNESEPEEQKKDKGEKKKLHFIFKKSLSKYTNVFCEEGYLNDKNASLMNDRFSKDPKLENDKIHWEGDIYSLMTFLYLYDRLGYIACIGEKPKSRTGTSTAITESGVIDKDKEVGSELPYYQLINQNFEKIKGDSEGNLSKILKAINNALVFCKKLT